MTPHFASSKILSGLSFSYLRNVETLPQIHRKTKMKPYIARIYLITLKLNLLHKHPKIATKEGVCEYTTKKN